MARVRRESPFDKSLTSDRKEFGPCPASRRSTAGSRVVFGPLSASQACSVGYQPTQSAEHQDAPRKSLACTAVPGGIRRGSWAGGCRKRRAGCTTYCRVKIRVHCVLHFSAFGCRECELTKKKAGPDLISQLGLCAKQHMIRFACFREMTLMRDSSVFVG